MFVAIESGKVFESPNNISNETKFSHQKSKSYMLFILN